MLRKIPVVIRLDPERIEKSDLSKELRINKLDLDDELLRQPGKYAWWAALYAETVAKCELLREKLDILESKLSLKHAKKLAEQRGKRAKSTDIRHHVRTDPEHISLRAKLRRWEAAERLFKYAERAFSQRKDVLQSYSANIRREKRGDEDG